MNTETRPIDLLLIRDSIQIQRHVQTESKGMEKIFHTSENKNKARTDIFLSDKIDFKLKSVTKDKQYVMVQRSIQEDNITVVHMYAPTQENLNI